MLTPQEEELLEAVLTGLRREDDPDVAAALANSSELTAELAAMRAMQSGLEDLGSEAQGAVDAASAAVDGDGAAELVARAIGELPLPTGPKTADGPTSTQGSDRSVEPPRPRPLPTVEPEAAPEAAPGPGPRPLWAAVGLLAAAALLWLGAGLFQRPDEPADTMLGGDFDVRAIEAAAGSDRPTGFEWDSLAGSAGSYRVAVYPLDSVEALFEASLVEPRWNLSPEQVESLPDAFRVEVVSVPVGGGVGPTGWLELR